MDKYLKLLTATLLVIPLVVSAAVPEWITGKITRIYADPSDIVYVIGPANSGPCGSNFFHIPRANENFKEFYSLVLTAFTVDKSVSVYVSSCSGARNITSHGSIQ